MSSTPSDSPRKLTDSSRVEALCSEFSEAYLKGAEPQIEDYLGQITPSLHGPLLFALLRFEIDQRIAAGDSPQPDEYCHRFEQYAAIVDEVFDLQPHESSTSRETKPAEPQLDDTMIAEITPVQNVGGFPSTNQLVGDFQLLEQIGQGGLSLVFRARQINLNRVVAIKMLIFGAHASQFHIDRLFTEARAVASLVHPNIVQIFAVGEHQNGPFLAMEYVDGGTLEDRIRQGSFTCHESAELIRVLALATDFAHRSGIAHRDLKPGNVLITSDGVPKITDFGLAKHLETESKATKTGVVMGTPWYMSPEQAGGETKSAAEPADIYALGAILYEMLVGYPPFRGESVIETLDMVRNHEPESPRALRPDIDSNLETICLKCLCKMPGDRYGSARALALDLQNYLHGIPIAARPLSLVVRTARWTRQRIATFTMLSLIVVFAGLAAFLFWSKSPQPAAGAYPIEVPFGLPSPPTLIDNQLTPGKVALGKKLFFETRLSSTGKMACATCHDPEMGWADGRKTFVGASGMQGKRHTPSLVNVAYSRVFFWDGRASSLEQQALGPILNPDEMGLASNREIEEKLLESTEYKREFRKVFPESGLTAKNVAKAIAAFERTLLSGNAPFDRFQAGDLEALSPAAHRGMELFFNEAHCSACHGGFLFSDGSFHNIGIGIDRIDYDPGREAITNRLEHRGSFKTPSLRDVSESAPYMHDGSLATLEDVVEYYNMGGQGPNAAPNPQLDEEIYELGLTDQQKRDLVVFLREGLTGAHVTHTVVPVENSK